MGKFLVIVFVALICAVFIVDTRLGSPEHVPYRDMEKLRDEVKKSPCLTGVIKKMIDAKDVDLSQYTPEIHEYAKTICFGKT